MARHYKKLKGTSYDPYAGGPYSNAYGQNRTNIHEHRDSMEHVVAWYERPSNVICFLILFFPVGLFLMWKNMKWSIPVKIIITVLVLFVVSFYYYYRFS